MKGRLILHIINGREITFYTGDIGFAINEISSKKWVSFQTENGEIIINTDKLSFVESVIE